MGRIKRGVGMAANPFGAHRLDGLETEGVPEKIG